MVVAFLLGDIDGAAVEALGETASLSMVFGARPLSFRARRCFWYNSVKRDFSCACMMRDSIDAQREDGKT